MLSVRTIGAEVSPNEPACSRINRLQVVTAR